MPAKNFGTKIPCDSWQKFFEGDTCEGYVKFFRGKLTVDQLVEWNP